MRNRKGWIIGIAIAALVLPIIHQRKYFFLEITGDRNKILLIALHLTQNSTNVRIFSPIYAVTIHKGP